MCREIGNDFTFNDWSKEYCILEEFCIYILYRLILHRDLTVLTLIYFHQERYEAISRSKSKTIVTVEVGTETCQLIILRIT